MREPGLNARGARRADSATGAPGPVTGVAPAALGPPGATP